MIWTLFVTDGENRFQVTCRTRCGLAPPAPRREDGFYEGEYTTGERVLVNQRYVVFMAPQEEGAE